MTTTTSAIDVSSYLALYLDSPYTTITGPVAGVWTVTVPDSYPQAALTAAVTATVAHLTRLTNRDALLTKSLQALAGNTAFNLTVAPTNAQTLAQVKALGRQVNALIKLATESLDGTTGT